MSADTKAATHQSAPHPTYPLTKNRNMLMPDGVYFDGAVRIEGNVVTVDFSALGNDGDFTDILRMNYLQLNKQVFHSGDEFIARITNILNDVAEAERGTGVVLTDADRAFAPKRRGAPPEAGNCREHRLYVQTYGKTARDGFEFDPENSNRVSIDMGKVYGDDVIAMLRDRKAAVLAGELEPGRPIDVLREQHALRLLTKAVYVADRRAVKRHGYGHPGCENERDLPVPNDYGELLDEPDDAARGADHTGAAAFIGAGGSSGPVAAKDREGAGADEKPP